MAQNYGEGIKQAFERARDLDASMNARLGMFANAVRDTIPAAAESVDRLIARLKQHGAGESAPQVGEPMPPFVLPDDDGRLVRLADLLAKGPTVVTFHRGHWCPYCRISINTLAQAQPRLAALGAQMVAIMPDRAEFSAEMKRESQAAFPILFDADNGYAMSLNLAIWVGDEMEALMRKFGNDLSAYQGNDAWTLPIPASFVVGRDGRITARFVDPDFRRRMTVEELLVALNATR
jgi:peroxiredoxin